MIPRKDQNAKPLTKDDLYGKSGVSSDDATISGQVAFDKNNQPLEYEETPIIEPIPKNQGVPADQTEAVPPVQSSPEAPSITPHDKELKRKPSSSCLVNIILYLLFFSLGIAATVIWRMYGSQLISTINKPKIVPVASPSAILTETPQSTVSAEINPTVTASPSAITVKETVAPAPTSAPPITVAGWKTIEVGVNSGYSIPPISIQLPTDLEELACDPPGCTSEGTDLPGGTRLTVAVHRASKPIVNFTKSKIIDAAGRAFPEVSETAVSDKPALLYSGEFTGSTLGGYTFSRMRGIMILVEPQLTLEINHFTYSGKSADFAADDAIFDKIIKTVNIGK